MSDLQTILEAQNKMPWFLPETPVHTTFDMGLWMEAINALTYPQAVAEDAHSLSIVIPPETIVGVGEIGATYDQHPDYEYRSIPWSKKMILLTQDVLVLIRVSLPHEERLREVIKRWLKYHGVSTSYDPASNDMLVNRKKFLGVQTYDAPLGWKAEFGMLTLHKDDTIFSEALPEEFQKNARGYELGGLLDEVPFDIMKNLPSLYQFERGEIHGY